MTVLLLVGEGYGARVYAAEWRLHADLSGRRNVPLPERPRAVDRTHCGRAQLRADTLGASRIETAGEDGNACGELALRVAGILTVDAKLAVASSAFGPCDSNTVLTRQGFNKLGFHERAKNHILRGVKVATDTDVFAFMARQVRDGELVGTDVEDVLRESRIGVHANQSTVNAEAAGSRIDIRKQSHNYVFGKLDEHPRSVHRYTVSARPLAENNVTGSNDGAADNAALRFQRGVGQIRKRYVARQIEVPRLDEHRRRYEDRHAVGSDRASSVVVRLDFAFDFEDKQGRISRRRYVYGRARGLGHRSHGG